MSQLTYAPHINNGFMLVSAIVPVPTGRGREMKEHTQKIADLAKLILHPDDATSFSCDYVGDGKLRISFEINPHVSEVPDTIGMIHAILSPLGVNGIVDGTTQH